MKLKQFLFTLAVMLSSFVMSVNAQVAKIGEQGYGSLSDAIAAANTGDVITLAADITKDVTVSKSVTIDGAGKKYTGTMYLNKGLTVTVKNVKFVNGGADFYKSYSTSGNYTFKGCSFDGQSSYYYPFKVRQVGNLLIQDCLVENYFYGLLYQSSSSNKVTIKDVTIQNCGSYGVYFGSGCNDAIFEGVTFKNLSRGVLYKNNAYRTISMTGCKMESVTTPIMGTGGTNTVTCKATGVNDFGTEVSSDVYAKIDATAKSGNIYGDLAGVVGAVEAGATVELLKNTVETVEIPAGVTFKENNFDAPNVTVAVVAATVNGAGYKTLAAAISAAQAGQTVTLAMDVTEDVTVSKAVIIEGAKYTYTGAMTLKADATINNLNFDGKGYDGYAITTRGANYLTINACTAKNYRYGFVQLASGTVLTTVKNVTVSDMNYGVKVDYSNAVVLDNVDITAGVAAVLNSNYGEKTITIKNSKLNKLGTWERNNTIKTTYAFEGANTVAQFITVDAIDNFKLAVAGTTLTAPEGKTVTTDVENSVVVYEDGAYMVVPAAAKIGATSYATHEEAFKAVKAGETLTLLADLNMSEILVINKAITLDGNGKKLTSTAGRAINVDGANGVTIKNLTINASGERAINVINGATNVTVEKVTATAANYAVNLAGSAADAVVTINNSDLTGLNVVNVAAPGAKVTVTGGTLTCNDQTNIESYAALAIATNASKATITATGVAFDIKGDSSKAGNGTTDGTITIDGVVVGQRVAMIQYANGTAYTFDNLAAAVAKAEAGETVKLLRDITASDIITINKAITLDGNGKKLTSTAARAFNIETEGKVVINKLTVNAGERAFNIINKAATVKLNGVTATANNNAVMIATSAGAAKVTIDGCDFTGLAVVNVAGADAQVAINNTNITNVDANKAENYGAITVYSTATNAKVTVNGGSITVADDSKNAYIFAEGATVTGVDQIGQIVAMIGEAGYETLTEAIADAKEGQTIKLIANATGAGVVINKDITIDFNDKTYTANVGVGSAGTQTLALQILKDNNVTLENGTLTSEGENIKMLINNYANLTVDNMKLVDATDYIQYVLSNNSGTVNVVNGSVITSDAVALDACKYASYTPPTVNVAEGVTVNGKVEVSATLNMNGTLNGAIVINGAEGIVKGAEGLTVTTMDGYNVAYAGGVYTIVKKFYAAKVGEQKYETLAEAVEAAEAGKTVELLNDVTGAGVVIDKDIIIDFNGKTYTVNKTVGSTGTTTLGLQILKDNNVVLKNGTLKSTAVTEGKEVKMLVQNYANLTVEDMNLVDETGHILYVLSNNSGDVFIKGNTNITTDAVAFDACKYANYAIPTVTVETTGKITGNIEVTGGNLAIKGGTFTDDVTEWCAKGYVCEKNADGSFGVVARKVVKVGDKYYNSLRAAVEAAPAGATVTLLENVTLEGGYADDPDAGLRIEKAITIKGNGYTVDCGNFTKGIRVYNNSGAKSGVSFYHITIVNNNTYGRCVDTRSGNIDLLLYTSTLKATGTSSQPLTLGGSEKLYRVRMQATTIDAGKSGYGVIAFVPSWAGITASTGSNISGLAAFYLKDGVNKTTLSLDKGTYTGINKYNKNSGVFATVVVEGDNNTIAVKASNAVVKAVSADGTESAGQAAFLVTDGATGNKIQITGEVTTEGSQTCLAMVDADVAASTSFTKNGVAMQYVAECGGYKFFALDEAFRFAENNSTVKLLADVTLDTKNYVTDCDGYASIINVEGKALTFDLNGKSVTVNPTAEELEGAKDKMLMSVFSMDTNGKLTLTGNGSVKVNAKGANVYSLVAAYGEGSAVVIENGSYEADAVNASGSLIYAQHANSITVSGGNFNLGNLASGANGSPWIFNTYGKNQTGVKVVGGTYPTDINHQFWAHEVFVPKTNALKDNGDGTWTVVPAVAYTVEKAKSQGAYFRHVGYASLEDAIAATGKYNCQDNTVTLVDDITGAGVVINKDVTIDFAGKAYSFNEGVGSTGTESNGFQILKGTNVVLKNGTLNVAADAADKFYILVQNYADNLTVEDMTLDGTNLDKWSRTDGDSYVLSNNSGNVLVTGNTNIIANNDGDKAFAFDACDKTAWGYTLPVVNVETTGNIAGLIESTATIAISGGIFTTRIVDDWCAKYYVPVQNADDTWTVECRLIEELTIDDAAYTEYSNDKEYTVAELTYIRNFADTEWQTIYLPFEVPVADLMDEFEVAYIYNASYQNNTATINYVVIKDDEFVLAANYPYMIRAKEAGEKTIFVEYTKLMPTKATTLDCSSVYETFRFIGSYNTVAPANDGKGYFDLNAGIWSKMETSSPFRFYMQIEKRNGNDFEYSDSADGSEIRMRQVGANGEATGVDSVGGSQNADVIFDIHGRRVLEPQKGGIYIINGKKVVF